MPAYSGANTAWHQPFDGSPRTFAAPSGAFYLGSNLVFFPRAVGDETVTGAEPSLAWDWGLTETYASINFTLTLSVAATVTVDVEDDLGNSLGSIASNSYLAGTTALSVSIAALPVGRYLRALTLRLPGNLPAVVTYGISAMNGAGGIVPPAFWTAFVGCHEVP